MKLFSRKDESAGSKDSPPAPASHRLTLDLSRSLTLAGMLANSRASRIVEVADLLAGMYIYGWDRLARYWEGSDGDGVEDLLRKMCRISPERWNAWIQLYDKQRRDGDKPLSSLPFVRKLQKEPKTQDPPKQSADLTALFKEAEEIAPFRDTSDARSIPIITTECVLLCIVRNRKSELSRKLASSGMNVPHLERDALSSRRARRG